MTPDLACNRALAMRRRHLRRKRLQSAATVAYHACAAAGVVFIIATIIGMIQ